MKRGLALLLTTISLLGSNVYAEENYITKAQIESAGKKPYSINYKYQQDYLNGKAIPESAIHYKSQTTTPKTTGTNILNWNGEYSDANNSRTIKVVQNGTKFNVTITNKQKKIVHIDYWGAIEKQLQIGSQYNKNSSQYKYATTNNVLDTLANSKEEIIPAKKLFSANGTLNGNTVWLYPGSNYQAKLTFKVTSQVDCGSYILVSKEVTISDNTSKLGKNPFEPNGKSLNETYYVTTKKYK